MEKNSERQTYREFVLQSIDSWSKSIPWDDKHLGPEAAMHSLNILRERLCWFEEILKKEMQNG